MENNQLVKTNGELTQTVPKESSFSAEGFEHAARVAKMLSSSDLVPQMYKNNIQNTMIALEMANRVGASPLLVMQNLNVIQGKPSWSSSFIIAAINGCKRFSPLRFEESGVEGADDYGFTAFASDIKTGDKLEGPKITWKMVKEEGWLSKAGSKWKTMPALMFRYRAAAFFGRLYAPDILMGMHTMEEVQDFAQRSPLVEENEGLRLSVEQMKTAKTEAEFSIIVDTFGDLAGDETFQKNLLYYKRKNIK